jgi:hypothetical protein
MGSGIGVKCHWLEISTGEIMNSPPFRPIEGQNLPIEGMKFGNRGDEI